MIYHIEVTPTGFESMEAIGDQRTRSAIVRRIDSLVEEPDKKGTPLRGWLTGFMSTRAAGQRYRVVYRVDFGDKRVFVYMGFRREGSGRDMYDLAERLVQRGLI